MSILVPVSGGPDSLYALKKAVEYGKGVHVLLVDIDRENNSRMYQAAGEHFVDYFKEWIVKEHRYVVRTPHGPRHDGVPGAATGQLRYVEYYLIAPITNILYDNSDITAVSMGVCREEFDMVEDISQHEDYKDDTQTLGVAYRALLNGREIDRFFLTLPAPTKQEIRDYVGEYLWGVSVSCRFPTDNHQACGGCAKCEARAATVYRGDAGTWSGPEVNSNVR